MASKASLGSQNPENGSASDTARPSRPAIRFVGAARRLESVGAEAATQRVSDNPNSSPAPVKPANGDKAVEPDTQTAQNEEQDLLATETPTSLLRVSNLAPSSSMNIWRNFCKQQGQVVDFQWAEDHFFVQLNTVSAASKILKANRGCKVGGNEIKFEFVEKSSSPKDSHQSDDREETVGKSADTKPETGHQPASAVNVSTPASATPAETAAAKVMAGIHREDERPSRASSSEQVNNGQRSDENVNQIASSNAAVRSPPAISVEAKNVQQPPAAKRTAAPALAKSKNLPAEARNLSAESQTLPAETLTSPAEQRRLPAAPSEGVLGSSAPPRPSAETRTRNKKNLSRSDAIGMDYKLMRRVSAYHEAIIPPPADNAGRSGSPAASANIGINTLGDNKGGWGHPSLTAEGYYGPLNSVSPQKRTSQGDDGPMNDGGAVTLADGRKRQKTKERRPDDDNRATTQQPRASSGSVTYRYWSNIIWQGVLLLANGDEDVLSLGDVYFVSRAHTATEMPFEESLTIHLDEDMIFHAQTMLDDPQAEVFLVISRDEQCLGLPFVDQDGMFQAGMYVCQNGESEIQLCLIPGAAFTRIPISLAAWQRESPDNDPQNILVAVYLDPAAPVRPAIHNERWRLDNVCPPTHWMQTEVQTAVVPTGRSTPTAFPPSVKPTETRSGPTGLFPDMSDLYHVQYQLQRNVPVTTLRPVNPHISVTEMILHPERFMVREQHGFTSLPKWAENRFASRIKREAQEPLASMTPSVAANSPARSTPQPEAPSRVQLATASSSSDVSLPVPAPQQVAPTSLAPTATAKTQQASALHAREGAGNGAIYPNRQVRITQQPVAPTKPNEATGLTEERQKEVAEMQKRLSDIARGDVRP
ncbi:hypothetical protein HDU86_000782 [Geranomyces michiganensis]|nr:hypothetical protein HDU86_000782 [Geranomyces michiganensis]